MYCENCGKLIEEGNKFCPYCGTKLVGTEEKLRKRFRMKYELTKYPNRKYPKEVPCKIIWKKNR